MSPEVESPAKKRRLDNIKLALDSCADAHLIYSSSPIRRAGSEILSRKLPPRNDVGSRSVGSLDNSQRHGPSASSLRTTLSTIRSDDAPIPVPTADRSPPLSADYVLPSVCLGDYPNSSPELLLEEASSPGPFPPNSQEDVFDVEAIISQEPVEGGYFEYESDEDEFDESTLSDEQAEVIRRVRRRENVFITGPAGTGKSYLVKAIIKALRQDGVSRIVKTATTGIAALNIRGETIHRWSGVGWAKRKVDFLVAAVCANRGATTRWREAEVLIIDEISMMQGRFFDLLEQIARETRDCPSPFGGIRLILVGDFFQLPPVPDKHLGVELPWLFAFQAASWKRCVHTLFNLTRVYRQTDRYFSNMLNSIRIGIMNPEISAAMKNLRRDLSRNHAETTFMFPKRAEVDAHNQKMLKTLTGACHTCVAVDSYVEEVEDVKISLQHARGIIAGVKASQVVPLRVGARVMLLQNMLDGALVNGSRGTVVGFHTITEAHKVGAELSFTPKKVKRDDISTQPRPSRAEARYIRQTEATQQLAKNIVSREIVVPSVSGERHRRRNGMIPMNKNEFTIEQKYPLVKFDGNNLLMLCVPLVFHEEGVSGKLEVERLQIPITMAWALTIHKSQGQTMSHASTNLASVFAPGHVYVALSRAQSMDGLQVLGWDPEKHKVSEVVQRWHCGWDKATAASLAAHWASLAVHDAPGTIQCLPSYVPHGQSPSQIQERMKVYAAMAQLSQPEAEPEDTYYDAEHDDVIRSTPNPGDNVEDEADDAAYGDDLNRDRPSLQDISSTQGLIEA